MITSAGAIGRLCIGGRPCRSALTGRQLAAFLVNTHEKNCPQHGTDAGTVPEMGAVGRRFAREQTARQQQQRMLRWGRAGSCRRRPAGNNFIVTMRTSFESIVNNNNIKNFILYNIALCHCITLCIVIVLHCVLLLYIIVYCIILCIVIVLYCVLLLYFIVYCYCISLCIVIVSHCVLYNIVHCHCTVFNCYCIVLYSIVF